MFEVRIFGDPVLRKTAKPITVFDDFLKAFAADMVVAMRELDGVGLAAPQVGESVRLIVIDPSGGEKEPVTLVNPVITWSSSVLEDYEEGCLSVPEIRLNVKRPNSVSAKALDLSGNAIVYEKVEGLLARVLQHEIDHLNGIMFVDHVSPLKRKMLSSRLKKLVKSGAE